MRIIFLLVLLPTVVTAQRPARGDFVFRVDGFYEGEAMEPWSARASVVDTARMFMVKVTVERGPATEFSYSYTPSTAHWLDKGRMSTSECSVRLNENEVPDFALPYFFAGNGEGAYHFKLTMLKCRDSAIERAAVEGDVVVEKDEMVVKGSVAYPFEVRIKDGRVLKFVQPQGSVGQAVYRAQAQPAQ